MKTLVWLFVVLPLSAALVVFAVSNRTEITYDFWPLPYVLSGPSFLIAVVMFLAGLLAGGVAMWLLGGRDRNLVWERSREVAALRREIDRLSQQLAPKSKAKPLTTNLLPAPEESMRKPPSIPIPGPYLDPATAARGRPGRGDAP